MPNKVLDEITYLFLNFNGATVEVKVWIVISSSMLPGMWLLIHAVIKSETMLVKWAPGINHQSSHNDKIATQNFAVIQ